MELCLFVRGVGARVLAGGAQGPLWGEAGSSPFQPVPASPPQGPAEPLRQDGVCAAQGGGEALRREGVQVSLGKGA